MDQTIQLLNHFTDSIEKNDEKKALEYKNEILNLELNSQSAVTAQYRLGFFILYKEKKLEEAMAIFKNIASSKVRCDDYFQAVITYGICLWSKGDHPLAIFELRKVLSKIPKNTMHEVLAFDYLSLFLKDSKAPADQITEVDEKRITALSALIQTEKDIETQSALRLELAIALQERGKLADLDQARVIIKKVVDIAPKLTKTTASAAQALLKTINKTKPK